MWDVTVKGVTTGKVFKSPWRNPHSASCSPDPLTTAPQWERGLFPHCLPHARPLLCWEVGPWLVDQSDGRAEFSGALTKGGEEIYKAQQMSHNKRHPDLRTCAGGQAGRGAPAPEQGSREEQAGPGGC